MNFFVEYGYPDDHFWESYTELWENSMYQAVFQSPHYMQVLAEKFRDDIAVFKCYRQNHLVGATFFRGDSGEYRFLSDEKTDHNFFLIRRGVTNGEFQNYFDGFLDVVKQENWSLTLNSQPRWARYMDAFLEAGKRRKAYFSTSEIAVCPVFEAESPEAMYKRTNKSRNLRYKRNRIIREQGAEYEVLVGNHDLEHWVNEFCQTHIRRWEDTGTPSAYRNSPSKQRDLVKILEAWTKDGALVRFAIKVKQERIAFCVGLVQENSLIYHSLTHNPDYDKYSPGKTLLMLVGEWMRDQGLSILDFGYGDEGYKYRFANQERQLISIFISSSSNILFILKSKLIKSVRENPKLIKYYREKIRPMAKRVSR